MPPPSTSVAAPSASIGRRENRLEITVAGFALLSLLAAQLMLSSAIRGSTYRGPDGAMVQTVVRTAFTFGRPFGVTNINPLQGVGSQLLPKNAWANPALWPFAVLPRETAAELSSAIALACYALACYVMARCFDVPVLPSALAAQLCILLFSPAVLIIGLPRNFSPTPADAVTYAPYLTAESGSPRASVSPETVTPRPFLAPWAFISTASPGPPLDEVARRLTRRRFAFNV